MVLVWASLSVLGLMAEGPGVHFGRCLCVYRLNHLRNTSSSCHPCWLRCRAFAWPALTSHASADVLNTSFGKEGAACFARKTGGFFCWESFIPFQWRKQILAWHPSRMLFWHVFLQNVIALSCARSVLS